MEPTAAASFALTAFALPRNIEQTLAIARDARRRTRAAEPVEFDEREGGGHGAQETNPDGVRGCGRGGRLGGGMSSEPLGQIISAPATRRCRRPSSARPRRIT